MTTKTYPCLVCKNDVEMPGDVCDRCRPHYDAWYADLQKRCDRAAKREAREQRMQKELAAAIR